MNTQVSVTQDGRRGPDKKPRKKPEEPVGFAKMPYERLRELASKGGRNAHQIGNAHEWTTQTSLEANRKRSANMRAKKGGTSC